MTFRIINGLKHNPNNAAITYRYDCWRAAFQGVCEAGWVTFGLLIVIRGYGVDDDTWATGFIKGLIPAAGFLGLLLNTISIAVASRTGWRATALVALYLVLAAALLVASALADQLVPFVAFFVVAHVVFTQQAPMMVHTYASNYTPQERGSRVSTVLVIVAGTAAVFSYFGGALLDQNFSWFPLILLFMAGACGINAYLVNRIPSRPLTAEETGNPLRNVGLVWRDKLFGWLLAGWMLMGFANLMTIPIRVEILANPDYGINATNEQISLANVIIPSVARLLSGKIWGVLFDRMNFIPWRIAVNSCFIVGMLVYFNADSLRWIYLGSAFIGIGLGGGMIGWNLWVTKIAPVEKVSAYMSIHTAFTGIRGIAAPFVGYLVLATFPPTAVGWIAAFSITVSSLMFARLWTNQRLKNLAQPN